MNGQKTMAEARKRPGELCSARVQASISGKPLLRKKVGPLQNVNTQFGNKGRRFSSLFFKYRWYIFMRKFFFLLLSVYKKGESIQICWSLSFVENNYRLESFIMSFRKYSAEKKKKCEHTLPNFAANDKTWKIPISIKRVKRLTFIGIFLLF